MLLLTPSYSEARLLFTAVLGLWAKPTLSARLLALFFLLRVAGQALAEAGEQN